MENVIMTNLIYAMTEESLYNMATTVAQGMLNVLECRWPQYLINP
jgi:hypothetical protein